MVDSSALSKAAPVNVGSPPGTLAAQASKVPLARPQSLTPLVCKPDGHDVLRNGRIEHVNRR